MDQSAGISSTLSASGALPKATAVPAALHLMAQPWVGMRTAAVMPAPSRSRTVSSTSQLRSAE